MRIYLLFTFILFSLTVNAQQFGTVSGKIITSDGQPASFISVTVKGRAIGAVTDESGSYIIKRIKPGNYTILASAVGIVSSEKITTINAGENTLDFTLVENKQTLNEVNVRSFNKNKVNDFVAKQPLKNLENPQVYNSVSSETMKQQAISNYDDALRNIPGISRTWESTGRGGDGGAYFSLRGFEAQPALINGLPGLVSGNLDPANVEEIQVLKGPSGTLFGASFYGYGGIINTITKKPYYTFGGEVGYNVASFGLNRFTVDVNTPLSKTKKIAFRLNAAAHTENSFQDAGFKKSLFIAPSFSYEVNDNLSFNLLAEILEEKRANAPIFFHSDRATPLTAQNVKDLNLNNRLSFTNNQLTMKNPRKNLQAQALYKFNSLWNSQTVFSASNIKSDGLYSYIYGNDPDQTLPNNFFVQSFNNQDYNTTTFDVQQNFNGEFNTGKLRHRLLIGLDYFTRTVKNNSTGYIDTRYVNPQGDVIITDSYYNTGLEKNLILDSLARTEGSDTKITNRAYSAYASDVINFTPQLSALLSLRMDYFQNKTGVTANDYNQLVFSPKFGLVYQPLLDKVSVFANYMNSFYNVAPSEVFDENEISLGIKTFKPERANQVEFGVKANLFADKLFATVSVYNTTVSNRVYYTPTSAMQGGQTRSRGIELDINANPIAGLNLIAGFSHGKIKVTEGNTGTPTDFYNEIGRSPGGQGPQTLANFWATYKVTYGLLKDFGAGIGGNYAGVYKVIDNSVTGVFKLPSYTLINASVFYNSRKIRVTANANNITKQQYYIGYWSVNPQKPRNYAASIAYKF